MDGTVQDCLASAYELKGLESKHEIISDGEINAQAMITWQEIKGNQKGRYDL